MTKRNRESSLVSKQSERKVKDVYVKQSLDGLNDFKPTPEQKEQIEIARNNTITFVSGVSGSGKTSAILWDFCKEYLVDSTKKIYVIRSPMEAGSFDKVGFLKGTLEEKLTEHFLSSKKILSEFLGKNKLECDMGNRIEFLIPNYMIGRTIDNGLILIDEAQILQPMILKLILERTGLNSRVVVAGDPTQLYSDSKEAKHRNGLDDAIGRFFLSNGEPRYPEIGYYKYDVESVIRSPIVKTVIRAYS